MTQQSKIIQLGQDIALYERLAQQHMQHQNYVKAQRYLEKVLTLSPDCFEAKQQLATCFLKLKSPGRAEALYYEEICNGTEIEAAYYELSQLNIDLNEPNKAYLFGLCYAFLADDEDYRIELEDMFEVAFTGEHPLEMESQLFVTQVVFQYLFGEGRLIEAREYLLRQDDVIKDHHIIRNLLAMCYLYLNDNHEAQEMFERLLREDPSDVHALCHYTLLLYNMNQHARFERYVKRLNKIRPINDEETFKLGIVLSYLKQYAASQQLLIPLHRKGKFQTFQLFHALSFNYYYLGNVEQSQHFWQGLTQFSKASHGYPPWIIEERTAYFKQHIEPLLISDDQHERLFGLFLLHQLNGKEVLMTKEVWNILEEMGDYEKLYLTYLIQNIQLTKLHFIHQGMVMLYDIPQIQTHTALFLSWMNYAENLLINHVDFECVTVYVAAVAHLYFNQIGDEVMTRAQLIDLFNVTDDDFENALEHLLSF
ncbi:tetratricopeptide repeat protein [Staphylococcus lutrae]|uniref:Tetratricopeptide repeat protein n=1 Tax=Staphylococcus lutrae TaxID=155085 RepID=A0AAC9RP49_9STAP|nr:tetratricopeptide repeat protein [Staphylococcus lutrae]ARJ51293.1 hypothetical protein B5P37_08205 [Staphylococcus lutrae]PNZ37235.1 hypothetical protein CD134_06670 [Staphylococcus lutrae]